MEYRVQERAVPSGVEILGSQRFWNILVPLVAVGFYLRTLWYGWIFEDLTEVVQNSYAHSLTALPKIFSNTAWAGSGTETYLYRPFLILSYALNHAISGLDPWSYHLANVLLFAGVAFLVVRVGRLLGFSVVGAGLAGLFFAVHPIHVEVVAPVFGRRDLLAVFFSLGMVLLHQKEENWTGWRMALPVGAFTLALLSKEVAVVGVAFVAAFDWLVVRRKENPWEEGRGRLYIGYIAVLLAYHAVRIRLTGGVGVPAPNALQNPLVDASRWVHLGTAVAVLGKGMMLQLFPHSQSPDYSYNAIPLVESAKDLRFLTTLAAGLLLVWWLRRGFREKKIPALLGVWYLAALAPTANILALVGSIFTERFLFFPSVVFCLAAGAVGAWALRRVPWLGAPILSLWVVGFSVQTIRYSGVWRDDVTLFRTAVERVPTSTKAQHELGSALLRAGELGAALPPLREALAIAPENRFAARTLAQARTEIRARYLPRDSSALVPKPPPDPEILHTLGEFSRERGDLAQAGTYWEEALALDSRHAPTLRDLGSLRFIQGDLDSALNLLQSAVREDPRMPGAWFNLGQLYLVRGNRLEAMGALATFLEEAGPRYPALVRQARKTLSALRGY